MIAYTVSAEFTSVDVAAEWVEWLETEHLAHVIEAGALDAEIVRIDGDGIRFEVRYHFLDRDAFKQYEAEHAPALRAAGLKRFPPERGVKLTRSLGEVVVVFLEEQEWTDEEP